MSERKFSPGFRLSFFDVVILVAGFFGAIILGLKIRWLGMSIGLVIFHFFLFCNVFRISRRPELIWGAVFVILSGSTLLTGVPGWLYSYSIVIVLSSFLIWRETKKEDYHGIFWEKWNPRLPDWWQNNLKNIPNK